MKKLNQYNSDLKKSAVSRVERFVPIIIKGAGCCLYIITFLLLFACDDFFEKDITASRIENLTPTTGWSSQDSDVTFSWGETDGATEYHFQLVSPSFESAYELAVDSVLSLTNLKLLLESGRYAWKVNGQNSVSVTDFSYGSFDILSPLVAPSLILPLINDTVKTSVVQFSWIRPDENHTFKMDLFSDAGFTNLVETKETADTTVFIEIDKNGQYFWRVNVLDQYGTQSKNSSTSTFILKYDKTIDISNETVELKSPVSSGYISTTTVSFWWEEVNGAKEYTLQVVSPDFSETTNLIINENLVENSMDFELSEGDYQWRVKASNEEYSTDYTTGTFKIYRSDISNELVSMISPLDEEILKDNEVKFRWEEIEGTEYQFVLKKDNWESGTVLHQKTVNTQELTYTLTDGEYYWGVKAKDLINSSETEFSVRSFVLDNTSPETPVPVYPVNNSEHQKGDLQFQWSYNNATEANLSYTFRLFEEDGSQSELIYTHELRATELNYTFNSIGVYYWQVCANDEAGNVGEYSSSSMFTISDSNDISNEVVSLNAPYSGFVSADTEIKFWWEKVDNAQSYIFQLVKPNFANIEELVIETSVATNSITLTLESGTYQWRVKAKNSSSQTEYSSANSLTVQ